MQKYNLSEKIPHQFRQSCLDLDSRWIKRRRRFDTYSAALAILKLSSGSNESYQSVLEDLELEGPPPSASSLCDVRKKLSAEYFSRIRDDINVKWDEIRVEPPTWNGFCLWAVDSTKVTIDASCENEGFYRAKHCHRPQALVTGLLRVEDRMLIELDFSKDMNERTGGLRVLEDLGDKDLVLFDRGFLSFYFVAALLKKKINGLFRVQAGNTFEAIEKFRESSTTDMVVDLVPSSSTRKKSNKQVDFDLPASCRVRLIKHFVEGEVHILATTVTRNDIPAQDFIDLYMKRWHIEELFKVFKCTLQIEKFHSKHSNGVEQELHSASILWNFSRQIESYIPERYFKKTN